MFIYMEGIQHAGLTQTGIDYNGVGERYASLEMRSVGLLFTLFFMARISYTTHPLHNLRPFLRTVPHTCTREGKRKERAHLAHEPMTNLSASMVSNSVKFFGWMRVNSWKVSGHIRDDMKRSRREGAQTFVSCGNVGRLSSY